VGQVTSRESARTGVRVNHCVSAVRTWKVPLFCLRYSCSRAGGRKTLKFGGLALKVVTHNGEDFVDVILIECIVFSVQYSSNKGQYTVIMLITSEPSVFVSTHILTYC
jgi:hypothetical protein